MKILKVIIPIIMLVSFSACGTTKTDKTSDTQASKPAVKTSNQTSKYPIIANERDPHIWRELVGDPMEAYFVSDEYKTKADPNSTNPIYSKDSFIKGTYPIDGEKLDQKTARVIIIQFKEDIDFNCILNKEKPAISIIYGSHGKDITNQFNFTYDCVTQKLLITNVSAGTGFGSGLIVEINGDNLSTAEIEDTDLSINGKNEHIVGQRSRKLSGKYSFLYDSNNTASTLEETKGIDLIKTNINELITKCLNIQYGTSDSPLKDVFSPEFIGKIQFDTTFYKKELMPYKLININLDDIKDTNTDNFIAFVRVNDLRGVYIQVIHFKKFKDKILIDQIEYDI